MECGQMCVQDVSLKYLFFKYMSMLVLIHECKYTSMGTCVFDIPCQLLLLHNFLCNKLLDRQTLSQHSNTDTYSMVQLFIKIFKLQCQQLLLITLTGIEIYAVCFLNLSQYFVITRGSQHYLRSREAYPLYWPDRSITRKI